MPSPNSSSRPAGVLSVCGDKGIGRYVPCAPVPTATTDDATNTRARGSLASYLGGWVGGWWTGQRSARKIDPFCQFFLGPFRAGHQIASLKASCKQKLLIYRIPIYTRGRCTLKEASFLPECACVTGCTRDHRNSTKTQKHKNTKTQKTQKTKKTPKNTKNKKNTKKTQKTQKTKKTPKKHQNGSV